METFFDEIGNLGQNTDSMLAGINEPKVGDELRSLSAINSSAESSELKFENLNTGNDDEILLPQNQNGLEALGLSESKESLENNPIEKNDPLIRTGSDVVETVDPITGETSNEVEIQRRSGNTRNQVNITSPTSRTSLEPGDRYTIRWTDNFRDNVRLELYKGSSFQQTISSSTSSDGSYSWRVPTNLSSGSNYRIRIRNVNNSSVSDYSSSFRIEPDEPDEWVNITSPTSSTSLEPGDRHTIRWRDNFSDNVRLDLYRGNSFQQIISRSTPSDGSHSWRVPSNLSSGSNYRIRARNVSDSSVYDYSSSFRIEPDEPDEWVNITSPTSSTSLEPGDRYTIRWRDNFSDNVRLDLYRGNSFEQIISSSTRSDGSHSWRVPSNLSSGTNYRIRARNVNDSSVSDYSSNFTIEPDEWINLTSPTSSSSLSPGDRHTIRWRDNFSDNVRLELYRGNSFQRTISSSTRSDGSHSWRVPTNLSSGSDYRIRARNVNDSSVSDYSSNFTIEPDEWINLTSPTSSSSLSPGDRTTIRWTDNFSDNVRLELYKGNSFQQTISSSTPSDGSHPWRVPTNLSSGSDYRIRARNVNDSSVSDYSSNFTIEPTWPPRDVENLGTYTGRQEYRDNVSRGNNDYYRFSVKPSGNLQFALRGLRADANVELLNSSGRVLTRSTNTGTRDEYGTYNLGTGTYYMRVYGNGGSTNYNLVLNLDQAGNDRSNARWLGELAGQRREYKDFIGTNLGDRYDYYKFSINRPRFLEYALRDLTANADVDILDSSGNRIRPLEEKDNSRYNQHETMGLEAGTYYARIKAPTSSSQQTNYRLVLNLERDYKPEKPDIDIQLDFHGSFTSSQRRLIEQAAKNWENIITNDKVPNNLSNSGVLKIAVTRGSETMAGNSWGHWAEAFLDDVSNKRYDRTTSSTQFSNNNFNGDNRIHFNTSKLNDLSSNLIVRLTMHEIGHTLGMDEAQYDSSLGLDSIMDWRGLDANITEGVYKRLEQLGYKVNRRANINWS